jgi:hypothetical protein
MSLSTTELERLEKVEKEINQLAHLVKGGGSKNQLNRLLVLAQSQVDEMKAVVDDLESRMETLLELAEKLQ